MIYRLIAIFTLVATATLSAQQPVPAEFQAAYTQIATQLNNSTLTKGWDQSKFPVLFGAELAPVSNYLTATQAGAYDRSVTPFINGLQSIGPIKTVKFLVHFPMLYLPFYQNWPTSGGMAAYNARLAFYQRAVTDMHARGIKVIVQSLVQGVGGTAAVSADPLNLAGYYQTLSFSDYVSARTAHTLAVCRLLLPDYLNFDSEPDTEGEKSMQTALSPANQTQFIANNLMLVTAIRDGLVNANPPIAGLHSSIRLAIGMGSWERYLQSFITNFTGMAGIDIVDIHVHPVNAAPGGDYLANIGTIADAAIAQGKAVGMDETSLYHETAAEFGVLADADVENRANWGFWSPVDVSFLSLMMNLANFKHMEYVSFASPQTFFNYLDYANTPGCPTPPSTVCTATQWTAAENAAVAADLAQNPVPLTVIGKTFQTLLAAQTAAPLKASAVSSASFIGGSLAPDSLVSIFGVDLASSTGQAQNVILPASLSGTTVTFQDASGVSQSAGLVLVSPGQVNAYVPTSSAWGRH